MIKLYGIPLSNYTNMVRHSLQAKGLQFEFVETMPSKDEEFLQKSPMGKIPLLETDAGFLTETNVILDFLEDSHPEPALYPADPYARAKVKQLMKVQELYVETPAHGLVGVLFGREVPEHVMATCQKQAGWGLKALARLVNFGPFICGDKLSYADIFVYYSFTLSNRLTRQVFDWNMLEEIDGLEQWYDMFSEQEVTRQVLAEAQD